VNGLDIGSLITNFFPGSGTLVEAGNAFVYAISVLILIIIFDYFFGWIERKTVAKIQGRHGPTYAGKYGILQNLADFVKLLSKENVVPKGADRNLFLITIPIMLAISIFAILLLPFSPTVIGSSIGLGMLTVFVLLSSMPLLIFINGFSSGNKFAAISAQRSILVLLGCEVPLFVVLGSLGALAGSYNIMEMINAQSSGWFVLLMPIGFIVFFVVMLAEMDRPPFDMREADSELIAGWLTDVSAPYYTLVLFLDYSKVFLGSLIIAILFFGGWLGPVLPPFIWLMLKTFIISFFIIIVRATAVRTRIDRLLRFGWLWLMPLSLLNLIITYLLFIR
jgi:NADH-quinone oxidoreductase subunit H